MDIRQSLNKDDETAEAPSGSRLSDINIFMDQNQVCAFCHGPFSPKSPNMTFTCDHSLHSDCIKNVRVSLEDLEQDDVGPDNHPCLLSPTILPLPIDSYKEGCLKFSALLENEVMEVVGVWLPSIDQQQNEMKIILNHWKCAAQENYIQAQLILGHVYNFGTGVSRNIHEAIDWYKKAGDQGCHDALFSIGNIFYDDKNEFHDYELAYKWFKLAADKGNRKAQNNLGNMFKNGNFVRKDIRKSYEYYLLSTSNTQFQLEESDAELDIIDPTRWYEKILSRSFLNGHFEVENTIVEDDDDDMQQFKRIRPTDKRRKENGIRRDLRGGMHALST